jgi:hypothetical protein
MYHTFPEHEQRNAPILYHMFAKLELENNRPQEALKILTSISSDKSYSKRWIEKIRGRGSVDKTNLSYCR